MSYFYCRDVIAKPGIKNLIKTQLKLKSMSVLHDEFRRW